MGIVVFLVLALVAAAAIAYPLFRRQMPGEAAATVVTDAEIERAVRALRRSRSRSESAHFCPSCGKAYQPGDRFCVSCGEELPQAQAASAPQVCPACGAPVRESDQFCAKCGQVLETEGSHDAG